VTSPPGRTGIRLATHADLAALGGIRAQAWRETYTGQLPESIIDAQYDRIPLAVRHWQRALDEGGSIWLALADGEIVGHAQAVLTEDASAPVPLELAALYLLRRAQGIGLGRRLTWTAIGDAPCLVWVLETNQSAMGFYRVIGFEPDGARREVAPGFGGVGEVRLVRH